jgi:hypothetical protein
MTSHTVDELAGAADAGSGFRIEGSEAAGVGVWRFADNASEGALWREGGESICGLLVEAAMESVPFLGCECGCVLRDGNLEFTLGEEDPYPL